MSGSKEITVPDIGDFRDVDVIDVLVSEGDQIAAEDSLISLETDKAVMDVPSPAAGTVERVVLAVGDKVSAGDVILVLDIEAQPRQETTVAAAEAPTEDRAPAITPAPVGEALDDYDHEAQLVVLGAGPGGYTAAFRAADLGLDVILVERWPTLGGVCLNVGCIPSKALLHAARVVEETREMAHAGLRFGDPEVDLHRLRDWKDGVVGRLTSGLSGLAKQRKVRVIRGEGRFASPGHLEVVSEQGLSTVGFEQCIIAAGSESLSLPGWPEDPRIIDSTGALELEDIPARLLVVGGGIIGLEMATVYEALGSSVTVVELTPGLIPGCDKDLLRPLQKRVEQRYEAILLGTGVSRVEAVEEGMAVTFESADGADEQAGESAGTQMFDRVLVAVGRRPNGALIQAERAGLEIDARGFIPVDKQQRTNVPHLFAIGDIVGPPMLAHKATHEGKVAAEVAAGRKSSFDARVIPSVAYTDPEIAWVGLTEEQARQEGVEYGKGTFPWAASGRSLALGRDDGLTKLLFDKRTGRVIGAGIVGPNAGDLIAEAALAIEMGCDASDIGLTIHPHPTLSETVAMAAEAFEGTLTDLYVPKRK